jgi:hypothetical protein
MTRHSWFVTCASSILVLLVCVARPACGAELTLVRDGVSSYSIRVSTSASPSERRAAEELRKFLQEMSGARLAIIDDHTTSFGPSILVGRSRITDSLKEQIPYQALGDEGFVLRTAGQDLIIAGGRRRGTMYGVYTFLEKLGCRWFTPDLSRIPKKRTITIAALNERHAPDFEYREPYFSEAFNKDWAARNKMNGGSTQLDESTGGSLKYYPFVHSFYSLIPPEEHFKQHPEYFSQIDGKRRERGGQLCLTNPDVLRLAVKKVVDWSREHPEAQICSVSQNDWDGWCECDRCREVEAEEGGAHSGPLLRFVNALAAEVEKTYPKKLIDTLAYTYTEPPPLRVRPRHNVRIRICPIGACEAHAYEQCPYNAYVMNNLRAWSKITSQLYVWHYNTNFRHYLQPFPDFDEIAADIPMYKRHGVVGLFMQGGTAAGGGAENAELKSWVLSRLLWDSKADVNQAVNEFMEAAYGAAAPLMREYFELQHRQVRAAPQGPGHHIWIFTHPGAPFLTEDFVRDAKRILLRAEQKATDSPSRGRVRRARLSIDYIEMFWSMRCFVKEGWFAPRDMDGMRARLHSVVAQAREFGITEFHEGLPIADDEKQYAARIKPYRAASIENSFLQLHVVPELSGRVMEIVDRRSGRNLLRSADSGERSYPDLAGLGVFLFPDHHGGQIDVAWKLDESSGTRRLSLSGAASNGLVLHRAITLAENAAAIHDATQATNPTAAPLDVVLQYRCEASPGSIDDAFVAFRKTSGDVLREKFIQQNREPTGTRTWAGGDRPDGEWRVVNPANGFALSNRFRPLQVDRAYLHWTLKAGIRAIMNVWSVKRTLKPGESLDLESDYEMIRE